MSSAIDTTKLLKHNDIADCEPDRLLEALRNNERMLVGSKADTKQWNVAFENNSTLHFAIIERMK